MKQLTRSEKLLIEKWKKVAVPRRTNRKLKKAVFGTRRSPSKKLLTICKLLDNQNKHMNSNVIYSPTTELKSISSSVAHLIVKAKIQQPVEYIKFSFSVPKAKEAYDD